jgi:cobalamin biosynthesis protein CobT
LEDLVAVSDEVEQGKTKATEFSDKEVADHEDSDAETPGEAGGPS